MSGVKKKTFKKKTERVRAFSIRKGDRYAKIGREMEHRVAELLQKKQAAELLHSFEYSTPNGEDDMSGKDFIVRRRVGKDIVVRAFGITISSRKYRKHQMMHPQIPCILITFEMRDERIWERIEKFF